MSALAPVLTVTLNPAIDLNLRVPASRAGGSDFLRATGIARSAGGKGLNVSRVLAELRLPSAAAFTAGGPDGEVLLSLLAGTRFSLHPLRIAQPTRTNVTLTPQQGDSVKVNVSGPEVSRREWLRLEEDLKALFAGRAWVVLAGSLPPGIPASAYARLTKTAHKLGARVALDCEGEAMQLALAERPDLIKPNRAELALLFDRPVKTRVQIVAAMRELITRGAGCVVVSAGKGEVLAGNAQEIWSATPPSITQISPMGAGDSMVAGLIYGLSKGVALEGALRHGVACGAACAAEPDTILAQRGKIKELLDRVETHQIG